MSMLIVITWMIVVIYPCITLSRGVEFCEYPTSKIILGSLMRSVCPAPENNFLGKHVVQMV